MKLIKVKDGDYVFLKWIDSTGNTGWINRNDEDIYGISTLNSVGIVLKITSIYICIVQSMEIKGKSIDNYINIPICAITNFKILK